MDRKAIANLQSGRNTVPPITQPAVASGHASSKTHLNEGQKRAIEEVLTSTDRVQGIQGVAGPGKTTALSAILEGAELHGYAVEGLAPTSKTTNQLKEAGIQSETLQRFLERGGIEQTAGDPNSRHPYMLDESSLASTRQCVTFSKRLVHKTVSSSSEIPGNTKASTPENHSNKCRMPGCEPHNWTK